MKFAEWITTDLRMYVVGDEPANRIKILVVDDEPGIVLTLAEILRNTGYKVATALSGEDAVAKASIFQPNLLLTDVRMGRMNGIEAAARIMTLLPECQVLFISADDALPSCIDQANAKGLKFDCIAKPASPQEVLRRVSARLAGLDWPRSWTLGEQANHQ